LLVWVWWSRRLWWGWVVCGFLGWCRWVVLVLVLVLVWWVLVLGVVCGMGVGRCW
jgi:hypothetical protein